MGGTGGSASTSPSASSWFGGTPSGYQGYGNISRYYTQASPYGTAWNPWANSMSFMPAGWGGWGMGGWDQPSGGGQSQTQTGGSNTANFVDPASANWQAAAGMVPTAGTNTFSAPFFNPMFGTQTYQQPLAFFQNGGAPMIGGALSNLSAPVFGNPFVVNAGTSGMLTSSSLLPRFAPLGLAVLSGLGLSGMTMPSSANSTSSQSGLSQGLQSLGQTATGTVANELGLPTPGSLVNSGIVTGLDALVPATIAGQAATGPIGEALALSGNVAGAADVVPALGSSLAPALSGIGALMTIPFTLEAFAGHSPLELFMGTGAKEAEKKAARAEEEQSWNKFTSLLNQVPQINAAQMGQLTPDQLNRLANFDLGVASSVSSPQELSQGLEMLDEMRWGNNPSDPAQAQNVYNQWVNATTQGLSTLDELSRRNLPMPDIPGSMAGPFDTTYGNWMESLMGQFAPRTYGAAVPTFAGPQGNAPLIPHRPGSYAPDFQALLAGQTPPGAAAWVQPASLGNPVVGNGPVGNLNPTFGWSNYQPYPWGWSNNLNPALLPPTASGWGISNGNPASWVPFFEGVNTTNPYVAVDPETGTIIQRDPNVVPMVYDMGGPSGGP